MSPRISRTLFLFFLIACPLLRAQEPAKVGRPLTEAEKAERVRGPRPNPHGKGSLVPPKPAKPPKIEKGNLAKSADRRNLANHDKVPHYELPQGPKVDRPDKVGENKTETHEHVEKHLHHEAGCDAPKTQVEKLKCEEEEKARLKAKRP